MILLANDSGKRARVPARGTPTIRRLGRPARRIVGTELAPVLAVTPLRLGIAFANSGSCVGDAPPRMKKDWDHAPEESQHA
jgi:hypothetical protein